MSVLQLKQLCVSTKLSPGLWNDCLLALQGKEAELKLAAADKHVAELKRQLEEAMHKLKLQSAADLPQSHRLYRITSGS